MTSKTGCGSCGKNAGGKKQAPYGDTVERSSRNASKASVTTTGIGQAGRS